jgi:hypothetical protein
VTENRFGVPKVDARAVSSLSVNPRSAFASALVVVVVVPLGCARPAPPEPPVDPSIQSYYAAIDTICRVDELAQLDPEADPVLADVERFAYLGDAVENPDGIFFRTILSVKSSPEKATMLRREARVACVAQCPLADTYERDESAPPLTAGR